MLLVFGLYLTAHAHEMPDLSQNGTITFVVRWEEESLDNGELALYRIGDIVENDGNYSFGLVPELAVQAGLEPRTAPVEDGEVRFADVAPSLYVAVQTQACSGFSELSPFLISMPRYENGEYVTDVVAKPKVPLVFQKKYLPCGGTDSELSTACSRKKDGPGGIR